MLRSLLSLLLSLLLAAQAGAIVTKVPELVSSPELGGLGSASSAGSRNSSVVNSAALTGTVTALKVPQAFLSASLPVSSFGSQSITAPRPVTMSEARPVTMSASPAPKEAPHLVFDVRGSRGGNGDVAAAYLTAFDLVERTRGRNDAIAPKITFVTSELERRILSRLTGKDLGDGSEMFDGSARVVEATLPAAHEPADVLLNLAAHRGEFDRHGHIPVKENGVIVTQTVFGNTESPDDGPATILVNGRRLELSTAGLDRGDAGVYADPVARALRRQPREVVRRFALMEARETEVKGAAAVAAILDGEVLRGAEPGLAYGIGMREVKPQFELYLQGLDRRARSQNRSFVVITPSAFNLEDVKDEDLRSRLVLIDGDRPMPETAQVGKIYVLKTGTMPHKLFVALMAYSRPPPIVAGDGAMSAAVGLGRPFVMTQVGWNAKNIQVFARRLADNAPPGARELLDAVYGQLRLDRAGELESLETAYARTSDGMANLTDTLFAAVFAANGLDAPGMHAADLLETTTDPVLRASLLTERSLDGDRGAKSLALHILSKGDARSRDAMSSALLRNIDGVISRVLGYLQIDYEPLRVFAAKIALMLSTTSARKVVRSRSPEVRAH